MIMSMIQEAYMSYHKGVKHTFCFAPNRQKMRDFYLSVLLRWLEPSTTSKHTQSIFLLERRHCSSVATA